MKRLLILSIITIPLFVVSQNISWKVVDTLEIDQDYTNVQVLMTSDSVGYYKYNYEVSLSWQFHGSFKTTNDWDSIKSMHSGQGYWDFTFKKSINNRLIYTDNSFRPVQPGPFYTRILSADLDFSSPIEILSYKIPNLNLNRLYIFDEDISYYSYVNQNNNKESIYNTNNSHNNWLITFNDLKTQTNFHFISSSTGFVVLKSPNNHQFVYRTEDFGKTWNKMSNDSTLDIIGIKSSHDANLILYTTDSRFFTSSDSGNTWTYSSKLNNFKINDIEFYDSTGIAIGDSGEAHITTNFGKTWKDINTKRGKNFIDLQVVNNGVFYLLEKYIEPSDPNYRYYKNYVSLLKIKTLNTTSIEEIPINGNVKVYPNPARDILNIEPSISLQNAEYRIFDLNGKRIKVGNQFPISIQELPSNLYILHIQTQRGNLKTKFIVE